MIGKTPEEALQVLAERSRDNGRTPMQWSDQMNAGFSEGDLLGPVMQFRLEEVSGQHVEAQQRMIPMA